MFAHACRLGLEGIVSKRIDAPYRSGRAMLDKNQEQKRGSLHARGRGHFLNGVEGCL